MLNTSFSANIIHMAEVNHHGLYFNGLNQGTISSAENRALHNAAQDSIIVKHVPINWLSGEPSSELMDRITKVCEDELKQYGKVLLIGASAGGSLAVNIFGRLHEADVNVVTVCSRLREVALPWWDVRSLDRMAHMGTSRQSQSFFDSVLFCSEHTLPSLTPEDTTKIVTVKQWADEIVPRSTMNVANLKSFIVPGFGHHHGIISGIKHLKTIVELSA